MFFEQGIKPAKICTILGLKKTAVYNALHNFRTYGVAWNRFAGKSGRPRILSHVDTQFLTSILD
jgi:hypothetical protein